MIVDNKDSLNKQKQNKVNNCTKKDKNKETYDYDFVPNLNEWLNIDEQRERTEELEDMSD